MEKIRLTIRIPEELNKRLEEQAKKELISKNALIIRACKNLVELIKQDKQ